jgi:hypothetical protein
MMDTPRTKNAMFHVDEYAGYAFVTSSIFAGDLERELAAEQEKVRELRTALALPSMWESAMCEEGYEEADNLLKRYGWDFKCSPGDFMEQYARAILEKTK